MKSRTAWGMEDGARVLPGVSARPSLVRRIDSRAGSGIHNFVIRTRKLLVIQVVLPGVGRACASSSCSTRVGVNLHSAVTALGLGGVAVGFALKDILSNLVSGVLILAMRPFEIDDQIVVGDTEGTVEQIELRATHIRTYDGRLVLVPNGDVFTSRITNNTASPLRRASVYVYLDYKEDAGRALSVILDAVKSVPGVASAPPPSMRLRDFSQDGLQLEARFWADSRRANLMNTASAARVAILRALKEAGIQLPDPDQRIVTMTPAPGRATSAETSAEVTYGKQ